MTQERTAWVLTESEAVRFWSRVSLPDGDGCMLWTRGLTHDGYGLCRADGRPMRAHRLALVYAEGQPPRPGMDAAHSCRNRHCVAPAHLRWASRKENLHDRVKDGTDNSGSRHGSAKMDDRKVAEIRSLAGARTGRSLARLYGVSESVISEIINGKAWKHVG